MYRIIFFHFAKEEPLCLYSRGFCSNEHASLLCLSKRVYDSSTHNYFGIMRDYTPAPATTGIYFIKKATNNISSKIKHSGLHSSALDPILVRIKEMMDAFCASDQRYLHSSIRPEYLPFTIASTAELIQIVDDVSIRASKPHHDAKNYKGNGF